MNHRCIALEHATMRVNSMHVLHADGRSRSLAAVGAAGHHACMPAGRMGAGNFFFFFFWIRGSTDLRRFERILGGSGSIRVSVDSFYPYAYSSLWGTGTAKFQVIKYNVTFAYCTKWCIDVAVLHGRPLTHVSSLSKHNLNPFIALFLSFFLHENLQKGCVRERK